MSLQFNKYSSIDNIQRQKTIDQIKDMGFDRTPFYVAEKAHGSNYSIYLTKCGPRSYKRSGLAGSDFFNHRELVKKHQDKLDKIYSKYGEIFLNGELMGGNYPHPEVERSKHPCVQKGIYYHPELEFYLFDARKEEDKYLGLDELEELAEFSGFCWAKPLFIGSLDDCLKYTNEYQTTIPDFFSLPSIENNTCEGNVIKPVDDLYFNSGSRVILKNKNTKFSEIAHGSVNRSKVNELLTAEDTQELNKAQDYITENRLRNVISKIGTIKNKDFGQLKGKFVQDITSDYFVDGGNLSKLAKKELDKIAAQFVRERFVNILDGEF